MNKAEPDGYRRYLLAVLLVILACNHVDRLAMGLLLQDIKVDLNLTDTQLGLLTGIAFALFYSMMGIPIARWADRGNRATIITVTTALWSAAVALCGVAGNFVQLLAIRVGVAVGEAGCMPPAHSLIADYFSRAERPRAVARYMLGVPLASVAGFFFAGWLNEVYGWRITFMVLGLPGLVLAILVRLTIKEPRRTRPALTANEPYVVAVTPQPGVMQVCAALWASPTFRHMLLGVSVMAFFASGIVKWLPAFFIRSHGLETGELGTWFAAIFGLGGLLGTYLGGEWASRHAARDERRQLRAISLIYPFVGLIWVGVYVCRDRYLALGLLCLFSVAINMTNAPLFATIQTLVPERMRAMSIALVYLSANLIGMGLGPLAVGALSDALRPWAGEESLRYALLAMCPGYLWCAWHLWRASRTVTEELEKSNDAN